MVDFKKKLASANVAKPEDPLAIYDGLDRAYDKGPLRPAQEAILRSWYTERRSEQDLIVKLHTGQGKTLIGLLMLQSKLNEGVKPCVYLCPNNQLVEQTQAQAKQFGFTTCLPDKELPAEFYEGKSILITSIQKLFNGLTKFGLRQQSTPIGTLVIDDAHACTDSIRDAFSIKLSREHPAYALLLTLFTDSLKSQGVGTFEDINCNHDPEDLLPVPYWEWNEKHEDVARILSKYKSTDAIKFTWPLLKDCLKDCMCVISGEAVEIAPYLPPLSLFGSYANAKHRIFMSATVTDDSFLVRGLRLTPQIIRQPLTYEKEKWSGEKMILLPALIDHELTRSELVKIFGVPNKHRKYGTVILASSFAATKDWEAYGAIVAKKETISNEVNKLKSGTFEHPIVLVNRYDGVDLPDDACRLLIFDSRPYSQNLMDLYSERCRESSLITAVRQARTIEQGLGRSVRGEKDYSVIIILGTELTHTLTNPETQRHLSPQTRMQIALGREIADLAVEELNDEQSSVKVLSDLITQCLKRDDGWKSFHAERMNEIESEDRGGKSLDLFQAELDAELLFESGKIAEAIARIQRLIDESDLAVPDRGWYLQEMARYTHSKSKTESNKTQIQAHRMNRYLLKPKDGMQIDQIALIDEKRIGNMLEWMSRFDGNHDVLSCALENVLGGLAFNVNSEKFERCVDELGRLLGFACQRPDKEWKEGPDNLWAIEDGRYLLIECKNEVHSNRSEIAKSETGQMNNSCAWFDANYNGAKATNIMIIPTHKLGPAAGFNKPVRIMRAKELRNLVKRVRAFYSELRGLNLSDLDQNKLQEKINHFELDSVSLRTKYSVDAIRLSDD